jgi:hypothetical protein
MRAQPGDISKLTVLFLANVTRQGEKTMSRPPLLGQPTRKEAGEKQPISVTSLIGYLMLNRVFLFTGGILLLGYLAEQQAGTFA